MLWLRENPSCVKVIYAKNDVIKEFLLEIEIGSYTKNSMQTKYLKIKKKEMAIIKIRVH